MGCGAASEVLVWGVCTFAPGSPNFKLTASMGGACGDDAELDAGTRDISPLRGRVPTLTGRVSSHLPAA